VQSFTWTVRPWDSEIRPQAASTAFQSSGIGAKRPPNVLILKLMLLNLLHKLDAADRDCRAVKPFETKHRPDPLLDSPMILLDHVV
jgi:hypothetical protein